jgi:hypothetical protein
MSAIASRRDALLIQINDFVRLSGFLVALRKSAQTRHCLSRRCVYP